MKKNLVGKYVRSAANKKLIARKMRAHWAKKKFAQAHSINDRYSITPKGKGDAAICCMVFRPWSGGDKQIKPRVYGTITIRGEEHAETILGEMYDLLISIAGDAKVK